MEAAVTWSMKPIRLGSVLRFLSALVGVQGTAGSFWGRGYRSFLEVTTLGSPSIPLSGPSAFMLSLAPSFHAAASLIAPSGWAFFLGCPGLLVSFG